MAGDREKTAGQAAREKVARREKLKDAEGAAAEAEAAAADASSGAASPTPEETARAAETVELKAEQAREAAAEARSEAEAQAPGDEVDQRSTQEAEKDLAAGTVDPAGVRPTAADSEKTPEELRAEVEAAREDLAETVEELTDRVDPRPKIEDAKQRVAAKGDSARENAVPIGAAVAAGLVALIWWRRRR